MVATLTADEVVRIHDVLWVDFAEDDDPIGYGGLRCQALLDSAVGRQHAGFGPFKKYSDPVANAATLTFGIFDTGTPLSQERLRFCRD